MKTKISRRDVIKSVATVTVGGLAGTSLAQEMLHGSKISSEISPDIKVLPPGPKSIALIERVKNVIGKTNYTGLYGVVASGGHGIYMTDVDGNVYLDCLAAASTNILGSNHTAIAQAYFDSASKIPNTAFGYTPNMETIELAEELIKLTPGNFPKKVMLGVSGSDANGGAIEVMRRYTGKMGLISFNNAYHGSTGLSQQASGFIGLKTDRKSVV